MPTVPAGILANPADFTGRYNTALTPNEEKDYQAWVTKLSQESGRDRSTDTYDYDLRGAFKSGASRAADSHLPDTFKKPNHPTFSVDSQYSGKDGHEGGSWEKSKNGTWTFKATADQLKFRSAEELESYFKSIEPDSTLVLP